MSTPTSGRLGKRGTLVIPAALRRKFGMTEGSLYIAEETELGILIRPAIAMPIEVYSPERRAEFLLSNAIDEADYATARSEVEKLGLDPDSVKHSRP